MEGQQASLLLQNSIKDNTEELHDFLADIKNWEKEMKEADHQLSSQANNKDQNNSGEVPVTHPVRSKSHQGPAKSIMKQTDKSQQMVITNNNINKKAKRLPCDYAAWEKFDVDKALESSEGEGEEEEEEEHKQEHKQSSSIPIPSSRTPAASKKERANTMKEEGNKLYSSGRLEDAVAKYTQGMALDPTNHLLPGNRAMAYIKLKKYTAAEADCSKCLKLDCCYIKGYLRRATARLHQGKEELARRDCLKVLEMEPGNKEAKRELENLRRSSGSQEEIPDSDTLRRQQELIQKLVGVVGEGMTAEKEKEQWEGTQVTAHKREGNGKKVKIIEVDSSQEDITPAMLNQILPIEIPPHLRSKKPLKRIPVKDVGSREEMNKKPVVEAKAKEAGSSGGGSGQQDKAEKVALPPKPDVLVSRKTVMPSVPRTSHQFTQDWHRLSNQAKAASQYLKTIPSAFFQSVELETNMLVQVAEVLASEEVPPTLAAQHLSALSASPGFSINLMFLEADQKQVLLNLTSKCKQVEDHSAKMEELEAVVQSS